ncbi:MAG: nodulation protein NfeD, partial [Spirochaetaceae bacterium]
PAETARRFVTENLTLGADAALEEGMIELVANDMAHLLRQLHGRTVEIDGEEVTLSTRDAELIELEMTIRQQLMDFISDPQVAFLLLMLGVYGIFFGLNMPGTFVPETLGAIALLLALFGLGMFSVDVLGIVLIVLAMVLFVAEAFTPTFGFLTAGGVILLILGALLMPMEPMMPGEWFQTFIATVLGMAVVTAAFFILVITKVIQSRNKPAVHDDLGMKGYEGLVMDALDPAGSVKIRGEWWNARSATGDPIGVKTAVRVVHQRGMELVVEPVSGSASETEQ